MIDKKLLDSIDETDVSVIISAIIDKDFSLKSRFHALISISIWFITGLFKKHNSKNTKE